MSACNTSSERCRMVIPPTFSITRLLLVNAFAGLFIAAAVFDLVNARSMPLSAILASIAWLSLVMLILAASVQAPGGMRQYMVNRLGDFSKKHFVKADSTGGG